MEHDNVAERIGASFARQQAMTLIGARLARVAPGAGDWFRLVGRVRKAGRTITVSEGDAFAVSTTGEKLIATMSATMMAVQGRAQITN